MPFWNMLVQRRSAYVLAWLWLSALLCAVATSKAATYYVAATGNNTNSGSQQSPWLTIGYAATNAAPGDIVRVQAGTYNERVAVTASGTSAAWITFVGDGLPVVRGFDLLTSISYLRIIGFEITHTNTGTYPYTRGIWIAGAQNSHVQIIDNYIHNTENEGIMCQYNSTNAYWVVRGNLLHSIGIITGVVSNSFYASVQGGLSSVTNAQYDNHNLFEYNIVTNVGDVFWPFGTNAIVRNNAFRWFSEANYTNAPNAEHQDFIQPGGTYNTAVMHQLYERNWAGDSFYPNSHFALLNDASANGFSNIVVRGNVLFNFGDRGVLVGDTKKVSCYNNTVTFPGYAANQSAGSAFLFYHPGGYPGGDYSIGNLVANCIIAYTPDYNGSAISINNDTNNTVTKVNNLGYNTYTDSSFVGMANPLFVSTNARNFRIQAGSPAIGAGTNIVWITSANGTGYNFTVNDPQLFTDGFGIVDGDTITVGKGGATTRITNINWGTSTVSVKDSVIWTNGMPLYWGTNTRPDIGALPYGSTELTAATLVQNGNSYTVTPSGDARGVWFYVDGIPTTWVASPPFTTTVTNGTVTAKAYALYAQANPVVVASNAVATLVAPPGTLRVSSP